VIPSITLSDRARDNFSALLARKPEAGNQLRIYVIHPGTSLAHCGIAFGRSDAPASEDAHVSFGSFDLLYHSADAPFLDGARVDYERTPTGEKLALKAPNIKKVRPLEDGAPLAHRVTYVLETEINPKLSEHDGTVMLHEIRDGNVAVLKFGGGCHGCGHAEDTLRGFVARVLKDRLPDLAEVIDDTDHPSGAQPHFASA
jgi:Fe/S biogenesis protein NfuA